MPSCGFNRRTSPRHSVTAITLATLVLGVKGPALAQPAAPAPAAPPSFADVPAEHWAAMAIQALAQLGIFTGYPDGTFGGKRAVTRYEAALTLQRVQQQVQRSLDAIEERLRAHERGPGRGAAPAAPGAAGAPPEAVERVQRETEQLIREVAELKRIYTGLLERGAALRREVDDLREQLGTVEPAKP